MNIDIPVMFFLSKHHLKAVHVMHHCLYAPGCYALLTWMLCATYLDVTRYLPGRYAPLPECYLPLTWLLIGTYALKLKVKHKDNFTLNLFI